MIITNLSGLLEKPQSARLTGQQCLKHPWLAQDTLHLTLSDRTLHKLETLKMRRLDMHTLPEHRLGYTFTPQVHGQVQVEEGYQGGQDDGQGEEPVGRLSSRYLIVVHFIYFSIIYH